jgi:hypothetical protein
MKEELTPEDYLYSVKIGSVLGFLVGWAIGIALLLYVDSKELNNWPGVPSIPIWNGIGWGLYGFIAGGSGLFAHVGRKKKVTAVHAPDTAAAKPQAA